MRKVQPRIVLRAHTHELKEVFKQNLTQGCHVVLFAPAESGYDDPKGHPQRNS